MSAILIPPWIIPDTEDYDLVDDATSVFRPELSPGTAQRQSFGGPRWKISRRHTVRQEELALLMSCLVNAEGQFNTVLSKVNWLRRGSFPATELISNNQFASGTTGWTSTPTEVVISVSDRAMRLFRAGISNNSGVQVSGGITTVSGVNYGARVFSRLGRDAIRYAVYIGSTVGANDIGQSGTIVEQGLSYTNGAAVGTTTYFTIRDFLTGKNIGSFNDVLYTSFSRVALVNGASQTGSALILDNLPVSTNGLLLPFDWISVNGELKMVTAPLNSDSSGNGYLLFKPALFQSSPDNEPVFIVDPIGKFLVTNLRLNNRYGSDAIVNYDLEEVVEL